MKKYIISFAVAATLISSSSFAALNNFLQIKGSKGSSQIVSCPNGACTVPSLVADTYAVSVVDAQGKSVAVDSKYECSIASPRDSASGMATGKRMHKPFVITKEFSVSTVEIAQDETNLSIACTSSPAKPAPVAVDASAAKTATYDVKASKK
jgi:hypothetical protein